MWDIFFYAVIGVGALLFFGLLYYRIDWARHPEKYKDLENDEKNEYWDKKQQDRQMREKKAKDKAKATEQFCLGYARLTYNSSWARSRRA